MLLRVPCQEVVCFATKEITAGKGVPVPKVGAGHPQRPCNRLGLAKWNPWNRKIDLGTKNFQQRFQNVDIMMVSWGWYHDLKMWNAQNPIMSNFENQEILIMSKFENTKNLIMSKLEMSQKSDDVKIWKSQKSDHVKNEKPRDRRHTSVDVIMISWKNFLLLC